MWTSGYTIVQAHAFPLGVLDEMLFYVRDIANPSMADQYFPVVRHKDFYIGHSWASGIAGGTRTQESSTEVLS